jgi:hypothetical protein
MRTALNEFLILCVVIAACLTQWLAYRKGVSDGKKMTGTQKMPTKKSRKRCNKMS